MAVSRLHTSPADRYAALCAQFHEEEKTTPSMKKGFGASALKSNGRIFAMLTRDRLVVKLTKTRLDELVSLGWGERFDANRGVAMKQWLVADPAHESDWTDLAREAEMLGHRPQANERP